MKLKNVLIVVKDIEKSKRFYHDIFGLEMILDNGGNMILTEGLVLQEEKYWKEFLGKDIIPENNASELYFEESDIEGFIKKLETYYYIELTEKIKGRDDKKRIKVTYDKSFKFQGLAGSDDEYAEDEE